ncbi:hypothetical protein Hgul01_04672 [Herpetosiphon gulosus]|uniref:Transposase n=1 Tax=Herpetosiphon gulosus TaxID=1973496 RepID=A0ABP9X630_9CHLR
MKTNVLIERMNVELRWIRYPSQFDIHPSSEVGYSILEYHYEGNFHPS